MPASYPKTSSDESCETPPLSPRLAAAALAFAEEEKAAGIELLPHKVPSCEDNIPIVPSAQKVPASSDFPMSGLPNSCSAGSQPQMPPIPRTCSDSPSRRFTRSPTVHVGPTVTKRKTSRVGRRPPWVPSMAVKELSFGPGRPLSADDCVDAEVIRVPKSACNTRRTCFKQIQVNALHSDGTLGLLLHGTYIVGFRFPEAKNDGWRVGDQIVEVEGRRVHTYDEFTCHVHASKFSNAFPIHFSVLRRESCQELDDDADTDDALRNFFNTTDFSKLTGKLQKKWGEKALRSLARREDSDLAEDNRFVGDPETEVPESNPPICREASTAMDNPFVVALSRRRDAHLRSNAGWSKFDGDAFADEIDSIAAQLAQRVDGGCTLHVKPDDTICDSGFPAHQACSDVPVRDACSYWPFCTSEQRPRPLASENDELAATPRPLRYELLHSHIDPDMEPPWLTSTNASRTTHATANEDNSTLIEMAAQLTQRSPSAYREQRTPVLPRQEHSDAVKLTRLFIASAKKDAESTPEICEHIDAICHVPSQAGALQQQAETITNKKLSTAKLLDQIPHGEESEDDVDNDQIFLPRKSVARRHGISKARSRAHELMYGNGISLQRGVDECTP